jgi:hypothetical protein
MNSEWFAGMKIRIIYKWGTRLKHVGGGIHKNRRGVKFYAPTVFSNDLFD